MLSPRQGVITYKEILKYLRQDSFLDGLKVEDLCSSQCFREYVPVLDPEDTLAVAKMIMDYTLIDYALVSDGNDNVVGYLSKIWVSKVVHYSNFQILNASLQELAQPLDSSLKFVSSTDSLLDVIQYLIEGRVRILVESEPTSCNTQVRLISPLTIVSFFLSSF